MEAIAAVGLASNVVQFVQFSSELLSLSASIRHSAEGSSAHHIDLELITKDVKKHELILSSSFAKDSDLKTLVQRASAIATELLNAIERIRIKRDRNSRWGSFRQALEIAWKKSDIDGLQSRLGSLRDEIEYYLVVDMQSSQYDLKNSLLALQSSSEALEKNVSSSLAKIMKSIEITKYHFNQSDDTLRLTQLQRTFANWGIRHDESARDYNILRSLQFDSMTVRHTAIVTAHERTFDWVFDAASLTSKDERSNVKFASWLQKGTGVYWVTGKPGSGKSTLMKFLDPLNQNKSASLLEQWAHPSRLIPASFYFWNAGTPMQKSSEGLLQSLLHKVLITCPELIKTICPERWAENRTNAYLSGAWPVSELERSFERLAAQNEMPAKFYFHVDGLDEYEGDHFKLIEIIENLARMPTFKICVASRPWNQFQQTIGETSSETLQLHLFTREDIEMFTRGSILNPRFGLSKPAQKQQYEDIVQEISNRAQGVFLWVRLVVHSLRDGFFNRDPISLLHRRLEELPTDLEVFFEHILSSVQPIYSERMARTFLTTLAAPGLAVIHYSYLDEEDPYFGWTLSFRPEEPIGATIHERASETRWVLNGRYKGLLEASSNSNLSHASVTFLHRTLRDFLKSPRMDLFLKARAPPDFDPMKSALGSILAEQKFLHRNLSYNNFSDAITFLRKADENGQYATLHLELIDHIELIGKSIYPNLANPSMHPSLLLRAALHHGLDDYIAYRVTSSELPIDLNWILDHLCMYSTSQTDSFEELLRTSTFKKMKECDCAKRWSYDASEPRPEIIKTLLQAGADPHAIFQGGSVRERYLKLFADKYNDLSSSLQCTYWKVLELLATHGGPVTTDSERKLWDRIIHGVGPLSFVGLLEWLRGFRSILQGGWKPHDQILVAFLFAMNEYGYEAYGYDDQSEDCIRDIALLILGSGVDPSNIVKSYHRPESGTQVYIRYFLAHVSGRKYYLSGIKIHELLEMFLRHGLDLNLIIDDGTIWEHLLQALGQFISNNSYYDAQQDLLLLGLQYGADPNAEGLAQIIGLREGSKCILSEPEALEVQQAVFRAKKELEITND